MNFKSEWKPLLYILLVFILFYFLPINLDSLSNAITQAIKLLHWYAKEHVILCLLPAFFIAGAIAVFAKQESVLKYLGQKANKVVAYGVASVSGSILAVCSCTVLPLFAGIYKMGAGIGPAIAFLYSGPAINILAIILTATILGFELGIARAVGAISFSVIIGLIMARLYRKEEIQRLESKEKEIPQSTLSTRQTILYFLTMIIILIFATWSKSEGSVGLWNAVYQVKWIITTFAAIGLGILLISWFKVKWWKVASAIAFLFVLALLFHTPQLTFGIGIVVFSMILISEKGKPEYWFDNSWELAKQIMPLLFMGVLFAGLLLGFEGQDGLIPSTWIAALVGGNSIFANFFASVVGAFMYFATLTEVPILQGLIANGMGKGPALALLLAGPALSLPSMLVLKSIIGWQKTVVYVSLVIIIATISGFIFGLI
jgi:uncharacterized protein